MRMLLSLLVVLLVIAIAGGVALFTGVISIAEQTPVPTPNPAASAPPAPSATGQLPAQAQAQAQPPQPTVTKQETYGDWIYTCLEVPQSKEVRCSIAQQLSDAKSKAVVFLWRIAQDGKGGLVGIWQTPEGVLLHRGITLDAGTEKPVVIPYETCGNGRCQAVANLAADYLQTLAKTEKATATLVTRQGQAINLSLSVNGLADGLAALQN